MAIGEKRPKAGRPAEVKELKWMARRTERSGETSGTVCYQASVAFENTNENFVQLVNSVICPRACVSASDRYIDRTDRSKTAIFTKHSPLDDSPVGRYGFRQRKTVFKFLFVSREGL
jgi:hypothetical protein